MKSSDSEVSRNSAKGGPNLVCSSPPPPLRVQNDERRRRTSLPNSVGPSEFGKQARGRFHPIREAKNDARSSRCARGKAQRSREQRHKTPGYLVLRHTNVICAVVNHGRYFSQKRPRSSLTPRAMKRFHQRHLHIMLINLQIWIPNPIV